MLLAGMPHCLSLRGLGLPFETFVDEGLAMFFKHGAFGGQDRMLLFQLGLT